MTKGFTGAEVRGEASLKAWRTREQRLQGAAVPGSSLLDNLGNSHLEIHAKFQQIQRPAWPFVRAPHPLPLLAGRGSASVPLSGCRHFKLERLRFFFLSVKTSKRKQNKKPPPPNNSSPQKTKPTQVFLVLFSQGGGRAGVSRVLMAEDSPPTPPPGKEHGGAGVSGGGSREALLVWRGVLGSCGGWGLNFSPWDTAFPQREVRV